MTLLNNRTRQTISQNFDSVVNYLERKFSKTQIHLPEVPSYRYTGSKSKLEITVFSNPQIAKVDVKMISLNDYEREPAFEANYDLAGLSIATFQRDIDDLISRMD